MIHKSPNEFTDKIIDRRNPDFWQHKTGVVTASIVGEASNPESGGLGEIVRISDYRPLGESALRSPVSSAEQFDN